MRTMRKRVFSVLLSVMLAAAGMPVPAASAPGASSPRVYVVCDGVPDAAVSLIARQLSAALCEKVTGTLLPVVYGPADAAGAADRILCLDASADVPAGGFRITARESGVTVTASDADGLFNGCRRLVQQLLTDGHASDVLSVPDTPERALMLDIGRKYYTPDFLRALLREMSWAGMNTLVLHFSEEMGLGLESRRYPWLNGRDGSLCVPGEVETDDRVLTQDELREIAAYAQTLHIRIVPSFDSPGHMNYIVRTFNARAEDGPFTFISGGETIIVPQGTDIANYYHYKGKTAIVQGSRNTAWSRGVDVSNEIAAAFTRGLVEEYADLFASLGCTAFDMGGDELLGWGSSIDKSVPKWQQLDHWKDYAQSRARAEGRADWQSAVAYDAFMYWMNDMNDLLRAKGYTSVRMWNDDALRSADTGWKQVVTLDKDVEILYWTPNANSGKNTVRTYLDAGYRVINCISRWNYYVLLPNHGGYAGCNEEDLYNDFCAYRFDVSNASLSAAANVPAGDDRVTGGMLCVWCDNPTLESEETVLTNLIPLIRAQAAKMWDCDAQKTVPLAAFRAAWAKIGSAPAMPPDAVPLPAPIEIPTEPPTEAPTEPPTEAPTEPPTEAPPEPPTEAPTAEEWPCSNVGDAMGNPRYAERYARLRGQFGETEAASASYGTAYRTTYGGSHGTAY